MFLDVGHYIGRQNVVNGMALPNTFPDPGAGFGQILSWQPVVRLVLPIGISRDSFLTSIYSQFSQLSNGVGTLPRIETGPLVLAHDQNEDPIRLCMANALERIHGPGNAILHDLAELHSESDIFVRHETGQFGPVMSIGQACTFFVRWTPGRNPEKTIKIQMVACCTRNRQMGQVRWVECASEDPNPFLHHELVSKLSSMDRTSV